MAADLATHDTFARADGWLADGDDAGVRPLRRLGAAPLPDAVGPDGRRRRPGRRPRRDRDAATLDRYLTDAVALVGADGSPLHPGPQPDLPVRRRGAVLGRRARRACRRCRRASCAGRPTASSTTSSTTARPTNAACSPSAGTRPWPRLAQSYSGPGSPYWAAKGMLGIALPADHPVWTAPARAAARASTGDTLRAVRAPGLGRRRAPAPTASSGSSTTAPTTRSRVAAVADSPLYARLGYSTATARCSTTRLGRARSTSPSCWSTARAGRPTAAACARSAVADRRRRPSRVGVAGSTGAGALGGRRPGQPDHGRAAPGEPAPAGRLTVFSLVRGAWELRLSRVDALAAGVDAGTRAAAGRRLAGRRRRPAGRPRRGAARRPTVGCGTGLRSRRWPRSTSAGGRRPGVTAVHDDASPLGAGPCGCPWLDTPVAVGTWIAQLGRAVRRRAAPRSRPAGHAALDAADHALDVRVTGPTASARTPSSPCTTRTSTARGAVPATR